MDLGDEPDYKPTPTCCVCGEYANQYTIPCSNGYTHICKKDFDIYFGDALKVLEKELDLEEVPPHYRCPKCDTRLKSYKGRLFCPRCIPDHEGSETLTIEVYMADVGIKGNVLLAPGWLVDALGQPVSMDGREDVGHVVKVDKDEKLTILVTDPITIRKIRGGAFPEVSIQEDH